MPFLKIVFVCLLSIGQFACAESSGASENNEAARVLTTDVDDGQTEVLEKVLERRPETGQILETVLKKNRYRQEPYQAEYDVQVPYQTTETYYENIPYQTTESYYENIPYTESEAYTDYEQQCEREYRCQNRPREHCDYENVCRTVPDRQCRQERLCRPIPGDNRCREVEECGTNALGQPICKTRKVCENGPDREDCSYVEKCDSSSRQECRQERRCETRYEQDCDWENQCRSVPVTRYRDVTKYRQELRTRTVTKYRQEARTREVTKYKTEKKCCVTKYRQVFDRQDILNVVVKLPETSVLLPGEVEKFQLKLVDNNSVLDATFQVVTQITNYKVIDKTLQGSTLTLTLEEIPVVINPALMGEKSVTGLRLMIKEDRTGIVVFKDEGQKGRTQTTYDIVVTDSSGLEVGRITLTSNGLVEQRFTLEQKLSFSKDHVVNLSVTRQGPSLPEAIQFTKSFRRPK